MLERLSVGEVELIKKSPWKGKLFPCDSFCRNWTLARKYLWWWENIRDEEVHWVASSPPLSIIQSIKKHGFRFSAVFDLQTSPRRFFGQKGQSTAKTSHYSLWTTQLSLRVSTCGAPPNCIYVIICINFLAEHSSTCLGLKLVSHNKMLSIGLTRIGPG